VLDLDAGTVLINATVVRAPAPDYRSSHAPSPAPPGDHDPARPPRLRSPHRTCWCRLPHPRRALRDPSNSQADLRAALDRAGYPWVTSHTFRKTVASRLDDAGLSIRHIADQLGHARPSTTLDHYLGRRAITTSDVADALTDLVSE
jgi:integrase